MRLKTYHASTMSEAMEMVRRQLGPEAIIVATHEDEGARSVRVTAAVERADDEEYFDGNGEPLDLADVLSGALDDHGTPLALADHLVNTALHLSIADPVLALAGALDDTFTFLPLPATRTATPLIFIGPPGAGKTSGVAKLAVRSHLAGTEVCLITTDTLRAGAVEQIATYAKRLGLDLLTAATPRDLADALGRASGAAQILIDTSGTNPRNAEDMERLTGFLDVASFEPVLVMAAGRDPVEAAELCTAFHACNPSRLVVTGLDMVRRLGSILAAAEEAALPFGDVSITPDIAAGLHTLNPVSLARLLLAEETPDHAIDATEIFKAIGSR